MFGIADVHQILVVVADSDIFVVSLPVCFCGIVYPIRFFVDVKCLLFVVQRIFLLLFLAGFLGTWGVLLPLWPLVLIPLRLFFTKRRVLAY